MHAPPRHPCPASPASTIRRATLLRRAPLRTSPAPPAFPRHNPCAAQPREDLAPVFSPPSPPPSPARTGSRSSRRCAPQALWRGPRTPRCPRGDIAIGQISRAAGATSATRSHRTYTFTVTAKLRRIRTGRRSSSVKRSEVTAAARAVIDSRATRLERFETTTTHRSSRPPLRRAGPDATPMSQVDPDSSTAD
jgi:hypothetical protein